eukprot:6055112-Pyramimonas_sp.AAC.1
MQCRDKVSPIKACQRERRDPLCRQVKAPHQQRDAPTWRLRWAWVAAVLNLPQLAALTRHR